jgi:hypothetical protein
MRIPSNSPAIADHADKFDVDALTQALSPCAVNFDIDHIIFHRRLIRMSIRKQAQSRARFGGATLHSNGRYLGPLTATPLKKFRIAKPTLAFVASRR